MSEPINSIESVKKNNIVRARVTIRGTRTLLQHQFGPDAIPLEKGEKTGVAGNDPEEWRKTCMVTDDGELYIPGTYVFSCLKNGAIHTKKGRSSLQSPLISTLQVEDDVILLGRKMPSENMLTQQRMLIPTASSVETFIYVASELCRQTAPCRQTPARCRQTPKSRGVALNAIMAGHTGRRLRTKLSLCNDSVAGFPKGGRS